MVLKIANAAFSCSRLNKSTFLIIQDDQYEEYPYIYVKIFENPCLVVMIDTGCRPVSKDAHQSLCAFIEHSAVSANNNQPLNPRSVHRPYLIITTHCHFDHIGGIPSFPPNRTRILSSGYDKAFLDPALRDENSLNEDIGEHAPVYHISHFVEDGEWLQYQGQDLQLQALHTPGHTPDSLTIYDADEHWLYTGDLFYQRKAVLPRGLEYRQAIIFPLQGNLHDYMKSLRRLSNFAALSTDAMLKVGLAESLDGASESPSNVVRPRLHLACGHTTSEASATSLLSEVLGFFKAVIQGSMPIVHRYRRFDEPFAVWQPPGDPNLSLVMPLRLLDEYRQRP